MKNTRLKLVEARKKAIQRKEEEDRGREEKRKKMMEMAIEANLLDTGKLDGRQSLFPSSECETSSKKPRKVIQLTSKHS